MFAQRPWDCTCTAQQALAILDKLADEAIAGDADSCRLLPGAIWHWLTRGAR